MYKADSKIAEEFIDHQEILETLELSLIHIYNNYCAIICAQITQEKSQITYDFVPVSYTHLQESRPHCHHLPGSL